MAVHFAGCCHPLPGDRIVGIVTTGKGVTIHTIDCETLESFADAPERWLDVAWDMDPARPRRHVGRLHVVRRQRAGQPGQPVDGDRQERRQHHQPEDHQPLAWISSRCWSTSRCKDVKHLTNIIAALRATPAINSVERARG